MQYRISAKKKYAIPTFEIESNYQKPRYCASKDHTHQFNPSLGQYYSSLTDCKKKMDCFFLLRLNHSIL